MGQGKTEIGVDDQIGKEMLDRQIEVLKDELYNVFIPNLEKGRNGKTRMAEQWEVDKRLYEITLAGFRTCAPKMQFEENPEFWELQKKKQQWKFDQEIHQHEAMMREYDKKEAQLTEHIATAKAKLKDLGAELDE